MLITVDDGQASGRRMHSPEVTEVGAQGDITNMYHMIRISSEEQMMQLFIWKFEVEDEIRTFCMT